MTMHLVGPYLTTTNYKKRKIKMTRAKEAELDLRWRERNKFLKSMGLPTDTFEQFLDYVHGKKVRGSKTAIEPLLRSKPVYRETERIPSLPMSTEGMQNACAKREPNRYTGTLIKGIATMHKSNAVPVINDEQARDISSMRR
jgi:hypothetical protein